MTTFLFKRLANTADLFISVFVTKYINYSCRKENRSNIKLLFADAKSCLAQEIQKSGDNAKWENPLDK